MAEDIESLIREADKFQPRFHPFQVVLLPVAVCLLRM